MAKTAARALRGDQFNSRLAMGFLQAQRCCVMRPWQSSKWRATQNKYKSPCTKADGARLTKLAGTTSLRETRRHEGDQLPSFPGDASHRDAFVGPFGGHRGTPVALATAERAHAGEIQRGAGVDQCLTPFRTVDRLSFTQTLEQNR
jgi:hypothetical protein